MRRVLLAALATAAIGFAGMPAQAATVLNSTCSGNCFTGLANVNLVSALDVASPPGGTGNVGAVTINFTSTTDHMDLANGAATISTTDGTGFGQLTFTLLGGWGFTQADFSLLGATDAIMLHFILSDGTTQDVTIASPTGSEPFGIQADAGTYITSVAINTTSGTYNTFKQLRLGGLALNGNPAVPEPASWALMLLGFGGIGMAMRRRRSKSALMQIA
jgi:hypothetical protein